MKVSSSLHIIPFVFAVITALSLSVVLISVSGERDYYAKSTEMIKLGQELKETSDHLTEQARNYVQYGEKYYLEAYYRETQIQRTRERILQELTKMGASDDEIDMINQAKEFSYELEVLETRAFDLVADGKLEEARALLFGDEYSMGKNNIRNMIENFRKTIDGRCTEGVKNAQNLANIALAFMCVSVVTIVITVFVFVYIINKKITAISKLAEETARLADGNFDDIDFDGYNLNDEFGRLANGLRSVQYAACGIKNEIGLMINETNSGNLSFKTAWENFQGGWSHILSELNEAVSTVKEHIVENAPVAFIVIKESRVIDCNRFAYEQLGMKPNEYIEIYYKEIAERREILKKLKEQGYLRGEKATFRMKNGEFHRYSLFINIVEGNEESALIVWAMDIEEEEGKTDIILRNQADVQKMVDVLPMAMIIANPVSKDVYYANTAFFLLMGYISIPDILEINEKNFYNYEQADNLSVIDRETEIMKRLADGETVVTEFTYKNIRGNKVDTRVTISEIMFNGKKCVLKIIQDISEEKLKTQLLQNAADHEREANRLKSSFLANMSHEIRTPMNAIIGFTQIALTREQDSHNAEVFRKINMSAKNLLAIINDILDFSKIEAQKIDLVEDVFSIEDIVANAFLVAADRIEDKKIEMLLDIDSDVPLKLYGDKTRMWQVLKNLLDNSAKYTDEGLIMMKVYSGGEAENGRKNIVFRVEDTGVGMTPGQIDVLFEPFHQFSNNYVYKNTGTGLGMSITKQLLELMDGKIEVESKPGSGTKIYVTVPFGETDNKTTLAEINQGVLSEDFSVLVIDDDRVSCGIVKKILEIAGFDAIYVNSSADAVNAVKEKTEKGEKFKIILVDYLIGDENGLDIGRELSKYTDSAMLLTVSAYVKKIPGEEIRELGFRDVLQKPLIPSQFIKRLLNTLDDYKLSPLPRLKKFKNADILLCEDNALNREIAVEMLRILGVEPDVARDGIECLEKVEAKKYDIILMDILMPNMDGREASLRIRASGKPHKDVCIIAMTANVMTEQIEDFMKAGMNGHIAKPIELTSLHDNLAKFLPDEKQEKSENGGSQSSAAEVIIEKSKSGFSIKGIIVEEGLARFAGNEERYKKSLLRFANDRETYHTDEGKDFARHIHTLKGVTANLGIMELSELAKKVESEFKAGEPYEESYALMKKELEAVSANIREAVKETDMTETQNEFGKKDEFYKLLNTLKESLDNANISESETVLNKLMKTKWIGVIRPDFKPISEALENYDFMKALELTVKLIK